MVESHLSIAPGERRDFFGERNEDHLIVPLEIRIHEAVQVTGKRENARIVVRHAQLEATSPPQRSCC
jgi:hypothetical protein